MRPVISTTLALAAAATFGLASASLADEWRHLGSEHVSLRGDRDVIRVEECEGPLEAIRLQARQNGIQLESVTVHFANGAMRDVGCSEWIPAGGWSSVMSLPGRDGRTVKKVVFRYRARGCDTGRAVVSLFGMVEDRGRGPHHGGERDDDRDRDRDRDGKPTKYRDHYLDRCARDCDVRGHLHVRIRF